jgi:hypothetical protein
MTEALSALFAAGLFGATNDDVFTIRNMSFPAGTLLFPSAASELRIPLGGDLSSTLGVTLQYRALPWNKVINSLGNHDTLVPAPVPTADFDVIHTV